MYTKKENDGKALELLEPSLFVVATPIGNLEDITLRALKILKEVDFILCEDTRKTIKVLQKYDIKTPLKSYRQHRKNEDIAWAIQKLSAGHSIALATDAGTPGISDPGSDLVREVRQKNIAKLVPIPGPSALSAALSICGWQTNPAFFAGFLSPRKSRRRRFLEDLVSFSGTIILYEAVHRLKKTVELSKEIFFNRDILIAREMTKYHEEFLLLKSEETNSWEKKLLMLKLKGEFTIVIAPVRTVKG